MNATDSTCEGFIFHRCTYELCTGGNGENGCSSTTSYTVEDWDSCTNQCCDSSVVYSQTYASIEQCQDYLNGRFTRILILAIVLPVLASCSF